MTGDERGRRPGRDRGSGPTIVIIPGFGLRPPTYEPTIAAVENRFRIVVPDVFGRRRSWGDAALSAVDRLHAAGGELAGMETTVAP